MREIDQKIYGITVYFDLYHNFSLLLIKECLKQSYLKHQGFTKNNC